MNILDSALAQKFIDKVARNFEYNINIMNENGVIIASKDTARIGDFHEVAYGLLQGTLDTGVVNEERKFIGTKPGVNLFIDYKHKPVGVICVTGDPVTVTNFAYLVKSSMETMLEYEMQMHEKRSKMNKVEEFLYYLLFEENPDMKLAGKLADDVGMNRELFRVPVIIKCGKPYDPKAVIQILHTVRGHSHLDLMTVARNQDIVMFKVIKSRGGLEVADHKTMLEEYYQDFLCQLPDAFQKEDFTFYVGTLQKKLEKYRPSFAQAHELSLLKKEKSGLYFIEDNILDFFRSLVNLKIYDDLFNIYNELFTEDEKEVTTKTIEVLSKNNYNVVTSAKELFIHRNTLVFRLNKIKSTLNIDPIANASDREFLNELAYYFRNR
jgi:carbohydrate diacid regulator